MIGSKTHELLTGEAVTLAAMMKLLLLALGAASPVLAVMNAGGVPCESICPCSRSLG